MPDGVDPPGPRHLALSVVVAAVLAFVGALGTVAFLKLLGWVHDGIWDALPGALGVDAFGPTWLIPVGLVGGAAVGVARRSLGEWPRSLQEDLVEFRETKSFDYRHLGPAAVLSIISLGFGAALGPEAALTALVGGLASWVAAAIRTRAVEGEAISYLGVTGALGALFGTAGAAAIALVPTQAQGRDRDLRRWWLLLPGLVAGFVGFKVFGWFSSGEGYFDYSFPDYSFSVSDVLPGLLALAVGIALGIVYLAIERTTERAGEPLAERKVLASVLGGLVLALLAWASPLVLFSGHEGIQQVVDGELTTAGALVAVALAKLVATTWLLSTGWKGGRFFPMLFAGAAVGIALSLAVDAVPEMVGIAVVMTAVISVVLRRAIVGGGLMLLVVPAPLWPFVVVSAVVAALAGQQLARRVPALVGPDVGVG